MSLICVKSSFDRFGDDLIELVLSYISFEDSFQYKCVSKQWKRLIFNKQNKVSICMNSELFKSKFNFNDANSNEFNLKTIEIILKNCPKITSIYFDEFYRSAVNSDSVFDLIINYCNKLSEFSLCSKTKHLSQNILKKFGQKFGSNLKKIDFDYVWDNNYNNNNREILKFCPNLTQLSVYELNDVFDGNQVLCKKLKSFEFEYKSEDNTRVEALIESNKNSLLSLNIRIGEDGADVTPNETNILFNSLSKLTKLNNFSFNDNTLFLSENALNVNKLEVLAKSCEQLKKLYLKILLHNIEGINKFFEILNEFKRLERLTLKVYFNPDLDFVITSQLFSKLENLKHLRLNASLNEIEVFDIFFESIEKHLPKLQSIDVSHTDITEKSFKCLSKLPELQSLVLKSDSELTFKALPNYSTKKPIVWPHLFVWQGGLVLRDYASRVQDQRGAYL